MSYHFARVETEVSGYLDPRGGGESTGRMASQGLLGMGGRRELCVPARGSGCAAWGSSYLALTLRAYG